MKKYILGAVLSLGLLISPTFAHQVHATGLDSCETNAIIQLIQAFNADSNVLTSVQTSLGIPTTGIDQSGNVCQPIVLSTSVNGDTSTTVTGSPAIDTNKAVDVFLIAGQSNAVGYGNATQSPTPPAKKVLSFYRKTISEATDPVGNASAGSAWPAFGTAYYNATGRAVVFVPSAVPGSGQTAISDTGTGNWDTSGTLFNTSKNNLDVAMRTLSSSGYTPTFKGILWDQGENDAIAINKGLITADEYQAALVKMIGQYRDKYGSTMPFYIFQTGTSPIESDVGYAAVRAVQAQVPTADPYTRVVFQGAVGFPSRSLMKDSYHYTQAGYNEMGRIGAQNIVVSDVVSTACTSWSYGAFGSCQSNNTQTRAVTASYPSGCTGGSPTVTQGCTYVPPVTTLASPTFTVAPHFYQSSITTTGSTGFTWMAANATHCVVSHPGMSLGTYDSLGNSFDSGSGAFQGSTYYPGGLTSQVTCYNGVGTSGPSIAYPTVTLSVTAAPTSGPWTVAPACPTACGTAGSIQQGSCNYDSCTGTVPANNYCNATAACGPTASWGAPSSVTVTSSQTINASYSSSGASKCRVYDSDGTSLLWDDAPTSWSQSNMGPFPAPFTHVLICYSATGVASAPAYYTLTVTNQGASAYDAYNSANNGTKSGMFPSQSAGNTNAFHYVWNNNLQIGSSNTEDVKALQTALTREGVYTGEVSGGFYNQTFSAVKAFQQKYGIDTGTNGAGFVGLKTRAKLNTLY